MNAEEVRDALVNLLLEAGETNYFDYVDVSILNVSTLQVELIDNDKGAVFTLKISDVAAIDPDGE